MPWGKMDDKFHRNRKVRALRRLKGGRAAIGDWAFWWSWCLDDPDLEGVVPLDELDRDDMKSAALLVQVGLWDQVEGGYRFHDFDEYNPTREQVDAKRAADRARIAAKRDASRERHSDDSPANGNGLAPESLPPRDPVPSPSHPVPTEAAEDPAAAVRSVTVLTNELMARSWHRAIGKDAKFFGTTHAAKNWRADYETAAAAIMGLFDPSEWLHVADALCEYFWLAPDGPVQSGRVPFRQATPGMLAKHISNDLKSTEAWLSRQQNRASA